MPLVLPPDTVVPFPRTLRWSATLHKTERSNFEAFHRNVSSQLKEATDSTRRLVKIFWNPEWQPDFDARTARLVSWDVDEMVALGNNAIRTADSSLDMGLQLINHTLNLGISKPRIRWTRMPERNSFHGAIAALPDEKAGALLVALKRTYNSMGYEGLDRYRDWLTHRGAPCVERTRDLTQPVPLPPEPFELQDSGSRDLRLWGYLWGIANNAVHVTCATFVPPVQAHSGVFTIVWGGLKEDAEKYRIRNQVPLDTGRVRDAGEELGRYPLIAYVPSVQEVVAFITQALTNELDAPLVELLQSRTPDGTDTFAHPSSGTNDLDRDSILSSRPAIRDEKILRERLEQLRSQFLQWGTPELRVFVITKDELRGLDPGA